MRTLVIWVFVMKIDYQVWVIDDVDKDLSDRKIIIVVIIDILDLIHQVTLLFCNLILSSIVYFEVKNLLNEMIRFFVVRVYRRR